MSNPQAERKASLDALLLNWPGVVAGQMFGYPAYYVNGKLFACLYGEGVGVKVPKAVADALLTERHVVPFQPLGRPKMQEWVQLNRDRPEDYRMDEDTLRISVDFVSQIARTQRKKACQTR